MIMRRWGPRPRWDFSGFKSET